MATFDLTGATVRVLGAGAVRVGVMACADAYTARYGAAIDARFATAPQIARAMDSGQPDTQVLIAPTSSLVGYMRKGLVGRRTQHSVGIVRAGLVVRAGTALPETGTAERLRTALLRADAVIHNRASSGGGVTALLERLGIAAELAGRTIVMDSGAEVIEAVAGGAHGNAVGIAQSTEIRRLIAAGVPAAFAGPLPAGAAIETDYMAGLIAGAQNRPSRFFVRFLGTRPARDLLAAHGVEPLIAIA